MVDFKPGAVERYAILFVSKCFQLLRWQQKDDAYRTVVEQNKASQVRLVEEKTCTLTVTCKWHGYFGERAF